MQSDKILDGYIFWLVSLPEKERNSLQALAITSICARRMDSEMNKLKPGDVQEYGSMSVSGEPQPGDLVFFMPGKTWKGWFDVVIDDCCVLSSPLQDSGWYFDKLFHNGMSFRNYEKLGDGVWIMRGEFHDHD